MSGPMNRLGSVRVAQYMVSEPMTLVPEMEVTRAIELLVAHRFSGAPVVDETGRLIGMLSEKDCLKVAVLANVEGVDPGLVGDYMVTRVETVTPDTDLLEVARRFVDSPFKRMPVLDDGKLVGQISRFDVLQAIDDLNAETR